MRVHFRPSHSLSPHIYRCTETAKCLKIISHIAAADKLSLFYLSAALKSLPVCVRVTTEQDSCQHQWLTNHNESAEGHAHALSEV